MQYKKIVVNKFFISLVNMFWRNSIFGTNKYNISEMMQARKLRRQHSTCPMTIWSHFQISKKYQNIHYTQINIMDGIYEANRL